MAETLKKGDFIEIEYDGKLKEEDIIFDTTSEDTAKKEGIYNPQAVYGKLTICIGQNQILPGVDNALEGKESEKEYDFEIPPEEGFGKKRADLLKMIPAKVFKEQNIQPVPGLQLNIDGAIGTVRTVSGGRIIVDFNHPLAAKELQYHIKIGKKVTDKKEQLTSYLSLGFSIPRKNLNIKVEGDNATVILERELPKPVQDELSKKIKELIDLKEIQFKAKTEKKPESAKPVQS